MAQFQFKDGLILDFGKVQYELHPDDPDFLQAFNEECERCEELGNTLRGRNDLSAAVREACEGITSSIERLLGDGAVAEIFAGRPVGFYDLLDVFNHITQEANEYRKRRQAEAVSIPQNREQRRAAAKASKPAVKKIVTLPEGEQT